MVNFRKLADRAKSARTVVDQQGGSDALKEKARKMQGVAKGPGSVGDRARAAAQVAREKPNPPKVGEVEESPPKAGEGDGEPFRTSASRASEDSVDR